MNLNITGHHVELTPAIREYATNKLDRVIRHFDHVTSVHVILSVDKLVQKAEVTLHVKGKDIFADAALKKDFKAKFGYDLAPPKTWKQFGEIGQFVKEIENSAGYFFRGDTLCVDQKMDSGTMRLVKR